MSITGASPLPKPLPPVKAEHGRSPPPPPRLSETPTLVKQERQELAINNDPQPHFINSVSELRNLSAVLSAFQRRYDELQEHLDFIRTSIDSKLVHCVNTDPSPSTEIVPVTKTLSSDLPETPVPAIVPVTKTLSSDVPETTVPAIVSVTKTLSSDVAKTTVPAIVPVTKTLSSETSIAELDKSEHPTTDNNLSSHSEIELFCKRMCSRSVRRYIVSHLSNVAKLREEVPAALNFAENPAKLVLDCFGRFFLQGIKAYSKDSPMIPGRQASVLILEHFLLMGCDSDKIDAAVKEEAELSAVDWRKRLINEGGLVRACEIDARGLLLLIGCFGIPSAFKNDDIWDLIRASHATEIADVLRRSRVLLARIPEVIERIMKGKREVEAVDIAYTFGVESRFCPQTILTSFLQKSRETWKRAKKAAQGSSAALNEADRKQLADLKSVNKCLENHKIDPLKVLPGWNLNEKISSLQKKIAVMDKKIKEQVTQKRKSDEPESSKNLKNQELKRTRFAYMDGKGSSEGLTPTNLLDSGIPQFSSFSAYSSVLHGAGDVLPTVAGSYAGVHGGNILVDRGRQVINHNSQPYGWNGDESFRERLIIGQSYAEPTADLGVNGLYRSAPSMMEGFAGLPNHSSVGVLNRSSASDLYQFADSVLESDTYGGSRSGATVPPVISARRSYYH